MKKLPILVPAVLGGVLVAGLVLAAPQSDAGKPANANGLDRAAAYRLAIAD